MGKSRMIGWLAISIALALLIVFTTPDTGIVTPWSRILVLLHKLNLITLAAFVGYWIDRRMFEYARPHVVLQEARRAKELVSQATLYACGCAFMLRRVLLVAAAMVAMAIAL
jgi:hypothetical protein